jgi:hypothetical protein
MGIFLAINMDLEKAKPAEKLGRKATGQNFTFGFKIRRF